jgi:hypothetical protein
MDLHASKALCTGLYQSEVHRYGSFLYIASKAHNLAREGAQCSKFFLPHCPKMQVCEQIFLRRRDSLSSTSDIFFMCVRVMLHLMFS